jgi:hypothetical protein
MWCMLGGISGGAQRSRFSGKGLIQMERPFTKAFGRGARHGVPTGRGGRNRGMAEQLGGRGRAVGTALQHDPEGAILYVLITMLGQLSGAHFNPAVTLAFAMRGEIGRNAAAAHVVVQMLTGIAGALIAHAMFNQAIGQVSLKVRASPGQWVSEVAATSVGFYIAPTSFANQAVKIMRAFSDAFAGIRPFDMPAFLGAQVAGGVLWVLAARAFGPGPRDIGGAGGIVLRPTGLAKRTRRE